MTEISNVSVLYAEDDENDVFFMERAFSRLKLRDALRVVLNGREAVDYLAGTGAFADRARFPLPELLLLDVKMPELSGLEVLKWAREHPAFARLRIVMFTSSTQDRDIAFSRAHRANGYFVKPANAQHLSALISKLLNAGVAATPDTGDALAVVGNKLHGHDGDTPDDPIVGPLV